MSNRRQILMENAIYLLIWVVVFLVPVIGFNTSEGVRWDSVRMSWLGMLPFVALFALNNYIFIPYLLLRRRYGGYIAAAALSVVLMLGVMACVMRRAGENFRRMGPRMEMPVSADFRRDGPGGERPGDFPVADPPGGIPALTERPDAAADSVLRDAGLSEDVNNDLSRTGFPGDSGAVNGTPARKDGIPPAAPDNGALDAGPGGEDFRPMPPAHGRHDGSPPWKPMPIRWGKLWNDLLIAVLLIGFNIAVRFLFKSARDSRRLKELEKQKLKAELDYLKAQVNPHFFMNTLNNIHALIDIDSERAKQSVIELSRIMRFVLYEADKPSIPLAREIRFIDNFMALMRMRYSEEVGISTSYYMGETDIPVPPLMLVTLVENAFKHGVSYGRESYIRTELSVSEGRLRYTVRNSYHEADGAAAGMGLDNLRKRLELTYGDRYELRTGAVGDEYISELIIPVEE